jgi:1-pyrroline-5-carboxylate dehydrogenase
VDAVTNVPQPANEPVLGYGPNSPERASLRKALDELQTHPVDLTMTIGGAQRMGGGGKQDVVQPHNHRHVLGTLGEATQQDAKDAIDAAAKASRDWRELSFDDRAAVFLKAADLLSGPWRARLNAATMLGQSKTAQQAEIDAACELADFWRFNVAFARQILQEQPISSAGVWNRTDYRPLEGFVINMLTGSGIPVSEVALTHPDLAGIHFTGSTKTFQHLWRTVGENIAGFRAYPRLVGETGGKDFVLAHASADPASVKTALTRGAFEYQGQKCSAASRAYLPRGLWNQIKDELIAEANGLTMGDVTDLSNFMGAVIDERAFAKHKAAIDRAHAASDIDVLAGGTFDDSQGYFVRPTILASQNADDEIFSTEYFGPILSVHVYDEADFDTVVERIDHTSPYALTGSILAGERAVLAHAAKELRFAAGNFYLNDKPTGAVVGQQPFGGGRASGTNDKAGSAQNLLRWLSPRSIKETFVPATDHRYPHMS